MLLFSKFTIRNSLFFKKVGWGSLGNSAVLHENISHQVLIASVTSDVCFAKDHKLGSMFAEGMFCAGGDGSGPCHGDSGNICLI